MKKANRGQLLQKVMEMKTTGKLQFVFANNAWDVYNAIVETAGLEKDVLHPHAFQSAVDFGGAALQMAEDFSRYTVVIANEHYDIYGYELTQEAIYHEIGHAVDLEMGYITPEDYESGEGLLKAEKSAWDTAEILLGKINWKEAQACLDTYREATGVEEKVSDEKDYLIGQYNFYVIAKTYALEGMDLLLNKTKGLKNHELVTEVVNENRADIEHKVSHSLEVLESMIGKK